MANHRSSAGTAALAVDPAATAARLTPSTDRTLPAAQPVKTQVTLVDGARVIGDYGADAAQLVDQRVYDATGALILFKVFDTSGRTVRSTSFNADGSTTTAVYTAGLLSKTFTRYVDGSRSVDDYNASGLYVLDRRNYDSTGTLTSFTSLGPNGHTPVVMETNGTPSQGTDLVETGTVAFSAATAAGAHAVSVKFNVLSSGTASPLGTLVPVVAKDTTDGTSGLLDWTYVVSASELESLNVGESLREVFDVTLTDGRGGTLVKPVIVTLVGTNDAPTLGPSSPDAFRGTVVDAPGASVVSGYSATGYGTFVVVDHTYSFSDPDQGDTHTASTTFDALASSDTTPVGTIYAEVRENAGGAGAAVLDWSYSASLPALHALGAGHTVTEVYDITVQDRHGGRLVTPVTVTVSGTADHPPVISVGAQSAPVVEAGAGSPGTPSATIQVSASDADYGDPVSLYPAGEGWEPAFYLGDFSVQKQGHYGTAVFDPATGLMTYTLDNARPATDALGAGVTTADTFDVEAVDSSGVSVTATARFAITGSNDAPTFVESAALGSLVRASTASDGTQANDSSSTPTLSPDGRKVAFVSTAKNLVPGKTDGVADVFVKDLATGAVTLVSKPADGGYANGASDDSTYPSQGQPSFSPNGTQLLFASNASNLVPSDTNGAEDLFIANLATGAVTRVSTSTTGQQANGDSDEASFSSDGRTIVFTSTAGNLGAPAAQRTEQVYEKTLATGALALVSSAANGSPANANSFNPSVSANGRFVAFASSASNLEAGTGAPGLDVFVKDLLTGKVEALSSLIGVVANSLDPVISPDGSKVAFDTYLGLLPGVTTGPSEVYVADLRTGVLTLVSRALDGTPGDSNSSRPVFSPDGRSLAFSSLASNLIDGETTTTGGLFVEDLASGVITRVTTGTGDTQADLLSNSSSPAFSANGDAITFGSNAPNLVAGDTNQASDVFVKDLTGNVAATLTGVVTDDGSHAVVTTSGALPFTDADPKDTHTVAVTAAAGDLGTLTATLVRDSLGGTTGVIDWTYRVAHPAAAASLSTGTTRTEKFTIAVKDEHGATDTQAVSVTLAEVAAGLTMRSGTPALLSAGVEASGDTRSLEAHDGVGTTLLLTNAPGASAKIDDASTSGSPSALEWSGAMHGAAGGWGTLMPSDPADYATSVGSSAASVYATAADSSGATLMTLRG